MKKRIFRNFLLMILLCVILLSVSVSIIVNTAIRNNEIASVKDRANLIADVINNTIGSTGIKDFYTGDLDAARITIIARDGTVLLDNMASIASLDNHSDRPEFRSAIQYGHGESTRFSLTLLDETYYYAIRLDNGDVLRISKTMHNIAGVFIALLAPIAAVTVLIMLIASILAGKLTKEILKPLAAIDFDSDNSDVYDELVPLVRKIDQQKSKINNQIDMLRSRSETIEVIMESMNEGLILIDKDAVLLSVNRSASDFISDKDMIGKKITHIIRDFGFPDVVRKCLAGENAEMVIERSGKTFNVYFSPVRDYEISGGVILLHDISEKHETEKQRREFSANVSHELKTPLTTISATAEMIENGMAQEEDIKAFAGKITTQTKRLINIIEDIIKLSEFDEGTIGADEYTEFDLYDLAMSVIEVLQQKADEKSVIINPEGEHFEIKANKQMIDELLFNLIDNAIKYNKDNGCVTVSIHKENGLCKISVSDTGIGIPQEHQNRVFERFYRVDKSRSKKTGGTGLGLSIVKHISEQHGGKVTLTSELNAGTTVECFFPDLW
ncbi:MAG: ATP-binding protein [Oscillospiraceae bacterium]|nr:ATP-binding protein [Oscillospiraceae bacterium]